MSTSPTQTFTATSTGHFARQMLASASAAAIIGSTSRGLFLLTPDKRVIFLSYEIWRGPLTVNIGQPQHLLQGASTGTQVDISAEQIRIPAIGAVIDLRSSPVWSAPPVPQNLCTPQQRQASVNAVAELVCGQTNAGFSPVIAAFLSLPHPVSLDQAEKDVLERLLHFRQAFSKHEFDEASTVLAGLLGYGPGLTPSGDDLIGGLLLAFNRWRLAFPGIMDAGAISPFNDHIISNAYAQTTALSANIIMASAKGQADERLIRALDALFSSHLPPQEIAALLLSYGATSGVDTLTGFALAISTIPL